MSGTFNGIASALSALDSSGGTTSYPTGGPQNGDTGNWLSGLLGGAAGPGTAGSSAPNTMGGTASGAPSFGPNSNAQGTNVGLQGAAPNFAALGQSFGLPSGVLGALGSMATNAIGGPAGMALGGLNLVGNAVNTNHNASVLGSMGASPSFLSQLAGWAGFGSLPGTSTGAINAAQSSTGTTAAAHAGLSLGGVGDLGDFSTLGSAAGTVNGVNGTGAASLAGPNPSGMTPGLGIDFAAPGTTQLGSITGGTDPNAAGSSGTDDDPGANGVEVAGGTSLFHGGLVGHGQKGRGKPSYGLVRDVRPGIDKVPVTLAVGSFVIPRAQVAAMGKGAVERIEREYGTGKGLGDGLIAAHVTGGEYILSPAQVKKAGGAVVLNRHWSIKPDGPKPAFAEGGQVQAPDAAPVAMAAPAAVPAAAPLPAGVTAPAAAPYPRVEPYIIPGSVDASNPSGILSTVAPADQARFNAGLPYLPAAGTGTTGGTAAAGAGAGGAAAPVVADQAAPASAAAPAPPASIGGGMSLADFAKAGNAGGTGAATPVAEPMSLAQFQKAGTAPAPAAGTKTGNAANVAAGVVEGGGDVLNTIADPVGNMLGKPLAVAGVTLHDALAPVFGYDKYPPAVRQMLLGDNVPQPGSAAVNAVGGIMGAPSVDHIEPANYAQALMRAGARGATGMAGLAATPGAAVSSVAKALPLGLSSGVGSEVASDLAPDGYKEAAGVAGGFVGGAVPAAGVKAAQVGGRVVAPLMRNVTAPMTTAGRQGLAAAKIQGSMTDPDAVAAGLAGAQPSGVPGDMPTTFEASGGTDVGLGALQRGVAQKDKTGAFVQRRREQSQAQAKALAALDPATASAADVADSFKAHLNALNEEHSKRIAGATGDAQQALGDVGAGASPQQAGEAMRGGISEGRAPGAREAEQGVERQTAAVQAGLEGIGGADMPNAQQVHGQAVRTGLEGFRGPRKAAVKRLLDAVDPDGTLALDVKSVREQARELLKARLGQRPTEAEMTVLEDAAGMRDVELFSDLRDLMSGVSDAQRTIRSDPKLGAESRPYRRMTLLREAIEQAMVDAVENAAEKEAAAGHPGQTAERLSAAAAENTGSGVGKGEVDPNHLIYREEEQNRVDSVRETFPPGEGYTPIVVVKTKAGTEILNGHNRAEVAKERGDNLPSVSITDEQYKFLKNKGFDDTEISYAALYLAREVDEARNLDQQFSGSNVADRGMDAAEALSDRAPAKPAAASATPGAAVAAPSIGTTVRSPSGRKVTVQYRLAEAGDLTGSHGADLKPNPAYPTELQPRERGRMASAAQIAEMAGNLDPESLGASAEVGTGAPIIGPDGVVESGNGRLAAIQRAYAEGGESAAKYRAWLEAQGYDTKGMREPVLVRARTSDLTPAERVRWSQEGNKAPILDMGAGEVAKVDASRISNDLLDKYQGGDIDSAANRDFVRGFSNEVLEPGERGKFATTDGVLSVEGAQRVRNALLHKAFGDSSLVAALAEAGDENIKAFGRSLMDAAGPLARLRAGIEAGRTDPKVDIVPDLLDAARMVADARRRGVSLSDVVAQQDVFNQPAPLAVDLLRRAYGADLTGRISGAKFAEVLSVYAAGAEKQAAEGNLFGENLSRDQLLNEAESVGARNQATGTGGRVTSPEAAGQGGGAGGSEARGSGDGAGGPAVAAPSANRGNRSILEVPAGPQLTPNFSADARDRLKTSNRAYAGYKGDYGTGAVGDVLRTSSRTANGYATPDSSVAPALFRGGPLGAEAADSLIRGAGGDPAAAVRLLGDYPAYAFRQAAEENGTLNAAKAAKWLAQNKAVLDKMPGLREKFEGVAAQQAVLDDLRAQRDLLEKAYPLKPGFGDADTFKKYFGPGPAGAENAAKFLAEVGDNRRAIEAWQDGAAFSFQQAAVKDGVLNEQAAAKWLKDHAPALSAMPEVAAKFRTAADAQKSVDVAMAHHVAERDAFTQSVAGKFLGEGDPVDAVGKILRGDKAASQMRDLAKLTEADPVARRGLQSAVIQWLQREMKSNRELDAAGTLDLKGEALQTFVKRHLGADGTQALGAILEPEQLQMLANIRKSIASANKSLHATKIAGGSDTGQNEALKEGAGHGSPSMVATMVAAEAAGDVMGHLAGHASSLVGLLGKVAAPIATATLLVMRKAGFETVDDMVRHALLNPAEFTKLLAFLPKNEQSPLLPKFKQQLWNLGIVSGIGGGRVEKKAPEDGGRVMGTSPRAPRASAGMFE